jgi:O-antigen/teichoic acid export membrane protein
MTRQESGLHLPWAFADQGLSSATNFGLSLLAGRILGPAGLGGVFLGFSAYLIALGYQRGMVTDPLVASSTSLPPHEREGPTRSALTIVILASAGLAVLIGLIGLFIGGSVGRGLLLFVPWLPAALVQDFWRVVLFRDGRASAAAANDGAWLVAMGICVPVAWTIGNEWAVVACWGVGAVASAALGFTQTHDHPERLDQAWRWYRKDGWPFGRWLAVAGTLYNLGSRLIVFILVAILGIQALGGLRAAQSLFAPLTLVIPAIGLPGLPALSRALTVSDRRARQLAVRIGLVTLLMTGIFIALLTLDGGKLLPLLFGRSFAKYQTLVWPMVVSQTATASVTGFALLLKAQRRGRAILLQGIAGPLLSLAFIPALAYAAGVEGAAWGMALNSAATGIFIIVLALRQPNARFANGMEAGQAAAGPLPANELPSL